jgi:hypothetical protein
MKRSNLIEGWGIYHCILCTVYSFIFGIAWWMIFQGKPSHKRWAIAANAIFIFYFLPALASLSHWRSVIRQELDYWPLVLTGIFGMIIFIIPYHGWRHKSEVPASDTSLSI